MEQQELQIQHYLRILWQRKWLVALTTLVALGAAFAFSTEQPVQPVTYEATATVMVEQPASSGNPALAVPTALADRGLQTQIRLMQSRNVLQRALAKLGTEAEEPSAALVAAQVEVLRDAINIKPITGTNLLEVKARAPDAELAEQRANAVVEAYVDYIKEEQTRAIEDALGAARQSLQAAGGPAEVAPGVIALLPGLAKEVAAIAQTVEAGAADLGQIQSQQDPQESDPPFTTMALDINKAAKDLGSVSRGLLRLEREATREEAQPSVSFDLNALDAAVLSLRVVSGQIGELAQGSEELSDGLTPLRQELDAVAEAVEQTVTQVRAMARIREPGTQERQLLADQARAGATALGIIADDLARLRQPDVDAATYGLLLTSETRIRIVSGSLNSAAVDLERSGISTAGPLAGRLRTVQQSVQQIGESLWRALALLPKPDEAAPDASAAQLADRVRGELAELPLSLDVASRQLSAILGTGLDPLMAGELAALATLVAASHNNVVSALEHLGTIEDGEGDSPYQAAVTTVRGRLQTVAASLQDASTRLLEISQDGNAGVAQETLADVEDRMNVAATALAGIVRDLEGLEQDAPDPVQYSQLLLITERTRRANARVTDVSDQLQQLESNQGPGYQELIQLQQELELLLLSPQDTGISVVDTAVSFQSTSASFSPFGVDTKILLGAIAGLLLGIVSAFTMEYLDRRVRTEGHLRTAPGLQPLGVVPRGKARGNPRPPLAADKPSSVFSEALQVVATNVEDCLGDGSRILLVSSPGAKDGKTMLAVNLAQVLARRRRNVLLVDGNLRKPDTTNVLNLQGRDGLATALAQRSDPSGFVVEMDGLHVLPSGEAPLHPVELLSSPEMASFLRSVQQQFDITVVDSAPVLGFAETKALAKQVGQAVLVVRAGTTSLDAVRESKESLEAAGAQVLGGVVNFVSRKLCKHLKHDKYGRAKAHSEHG